jgi:hypothetical protein
MGYLAGLSEPPAIDVDEPREELPSQDELLDANETLARQVSLLTTQVQMLQIENADLKRRIAG